jgi:hypothetical protein
LGDLQVLKFLIQKCQDFRGSKAVFSQQFLNLSSSQRDMSIDYRCDDEKQKSSVGATSWYHCVAEDSWIPKMPVINLLQALVHPQTQKNYPAWIVNPQPQLLRPRLFW